MPRATMDLTHDHRELGALLAAVNESLARVAQGQRRLEDEAHELKDGLEALRDVMLEHFAKEQESLFPAVSAAFPERSDDTADLTREHDAIARELDALVETLARSLSLGSVAELANRIEQFEASYASHTLKERAFLELVDEASRNNQAFGRALSEALGESVHGAASIPVPRPA